MTDTMPPICPHCSAALGEPISLGVFRCTHCLRLSIGLLDQPRPIMVSEARLLFEDPIIRDALGLADATTNQGAAAALLARCTCGWVVSRHGHLARKINTDCPWHNDHDITSPEGSRS